MIAREKAPGACDAGGLGNASTFAAINSIAKAEANTLARFALAGHEVHKCRFGDYVVTRRGVTKYCADFEALQEFARQLGVLR